MNTNKYRIRVHSCRSNNDFQMQLSDQEAELMKRVARLSQMSSQSECQATLHIAKVTKIIVTGEVK